MQMCLANAVMRLTSANLLRRNGQTANTAVPRKTNSENKKSRHRCYPTQPAHRRWLGHATACPPTNSIGTRLPGRLVYDAQVCVVKSISQLFGVVTAHESTAI